MAKKEREEGDHRLDIEWLVINALRENLSLIREKDNASYDETIRFAQENFKELFENEDSYFGKRTTRGSEFERYAQEAIARSRKEGKVMKPEDLIKERIETISALLRYPENKKGGFSRLKAERRRLNKLLLENKSRFSLVTENQALMNDFHAKRPGMKLEKSFAGKYNVYKTNTDQKFVLRFLHPGAAEAATGVDLIYEVYDVKKQLVRVISIQYKIWEDEVLYFSKIKNIEKQLQRATECFCGKGYCEAADGAKKSYRFPHCIPFLRPTDKIYDTENLITSGWHIPLCELDEYLDHSPALGKILRLERINKSALDVETFEKLFQQEKIGSRWLTIKEVEAFYKTKKVIDPNENIVIFSQKIID
ncbi:MAG: hypothetical protein M3R17_11515 [Bacteroidota bacterium]|nr:hypothetical protein [Bacteroidota bacterium]